jgi:hypothetical protein
MQILSYRPPLWSSGQSSWLQIQRFRVRFPALPGLQKISGPETESTITVTLYWPIVPALDVR